MVNTSADSKRRWWADVITILTGLSVMGLAIWPGRTTASNAVAVELGNASVLWGVHAAAGGLAIAGVIIAQRWRSRSLAKALVVLAGLALLGVFLSFRDFGARALLTTLLPGVLLVLSGAMLGPMPGPSETSPRRA